MKSKKSVLSPSVADQKPEAHPTLPSNDPSLVGVFLKAIAATIFFLLILIVITLAGLGIFAYQKLNGFAQQVNTTVPELYQTLKTGWNAPVTQTNGHKNILILGVDTLQTRGNAAPLTDTMMLASLDLDSGQVQTLSLPRDLWSEEYKTRINALYAYGQDRYPSQPQQFPTEVIAALTQVPIHHTLVLSLDQVSTLIDTLGGIEINVENGFVDTAFPRTDVDVTVERDPAKLYETVEFVAGPQTMTGERALKYIRSRHSTGQEGDDVARSRRQQQVIAALIKKLTQPTTLTNTSTLAELYKFYTTQFAPFISLNEMIATARALLPHRDSISFSGSGLSIYPTDPQGVLTHPPVSTTQNQWVYTIKDTAALQAEVKQKLGL